jgi:peptidyl-tRNA hydrolase
MATVGDRVLDKSDTTKESGEWKITNNKLNAGWYKIVATTKDKYGEEVKAEKYIQLTSEKQNPKEIGEAVIVDAKKTSLEPGEKIDYSNQNRL